MDENKDHPCADRLDCELEIQAALLFESIARDLRVLFEPLDVNTAESAGHALEVFIPLISNIGSYRRDVRSLRARLESKK